MRVSAPKNRSRRAASSTASLEYDRSPQRAIQQQDARRRFIGPEGLRRARLRDIEIEHRQMIRVR